MKKNFKSACQSKYVSIFISVVFCALCFVCFAVSAPKNVYAEAYAGFDGIVVNESAPLGVLATLDERNGTHYADYDYKPDKILPVKYGKVYKFRQVRNGVDIPSGDIVVCTDKNNKALSVFGEPNKTATQADSFGSAGMSGVTVSVEQPDALGNTVSVPVEHTSESEFMLADYTRNIFVVDATGGEYVYYQNDSGVFEPIAVTAYNNVIRAYDFYTEANIGVTRLGANGGNDEVWGNYNDVESEKPIMVYVHYGDKYENANCGYDERSGYVMMYVGDGRKDGSIYLPGNAADVIGHEYQHAVTQFIAGFEYMNDSAALNEGISDIFGALIEGYDPSDNRFWNIGEDCAAGGTNFLRSIKGGTSRYKYSMSNKVHNCTLSHDHKACDYGGAHVNSTIISHTQYVLYKALPTCFTREVIGELWYSTLCALTPQSTFDDFGLRFYRTAQNLGYDKTVCDTIFDCLVERELLPVHTVTYTDYDGSEIAHKYVLDGEDAAIPDAPVRQSDEQYDYEFAGWSQSAENVTSDMTIVAEYKQALRKYKVTLIDARTFKVISSADYEYGGKIELPSTPNTADYRFDGWYEDEQFTILFDPDMLITADITLYAKYVKIENPDYLLIIGIVAAVVFLAILGVLAIVKRR